MILSWDMKDMTISMEGKEMILLMAIQAKTL